EPAGDEGGLAVAGQAGDADSSEAAQREVAVLAEVIAAHIQNVGDVGFVGAGRAAVRAERFGKRVGAQGADDEASGRGLGDADTDGPPVVSDVRGLLLN